MDVVSKRMTISSSGTVVRQFVPTRIEREVLAHVFALVCGQRNQIDARCDGDALPDSSLREDDQRTDICVERRRVS